MLKITTKTVKDESHRKIIQVTVPKGELERRMDEASANLVPTTALQGFRKGKVPTNLLRRRYGEALKNRATEAIASEQVNALMGKFGGDLLGEPQIEFIAADKVARKGDLVFNLSFSFAPKVPKIDFGKLKLQRPRLEATDQSVEKALEQLAARTPIYVTKDGAAAKGDKVKVRSSAHIKGVRGAPRAEEFEAVLGQGNFFTQIEEALVGVKVGEQKRVSFTLDKNYEDRRIAGRRATFDLNVVEVGKPQLTKADDSFARSLKFADLAALKAELRSRLQSQAAQLEQGDLRASLIAEISRLYPFEIPEDLLSRQRQKPEQKEPTPQQRKQQLAAMKAELRLGFVIRETVKRAAIKLEDDELKNAVAANEKHFRARGETLTEAQKQQLSSRLTNSLLERKVLNYIYSKASIQYQEQHQEPHKERHKEPRKKTVFGSVAAKNPQTDPQVGKPVKSKSLKTKKTKKMKKTKEHK